MRCEALDFEIAQTGWNGIDPLPGAERESYLRYCAYVFSLLHCRPFNLTNTRTCLFHGKTSEMSDVSELSASDVAFLGPHLPPSSGLPPSILHTEGEHEGLVSSQPLLNPVVDEALPAQELPFVTLTYASSLDGMISLAPGLRTTLSGPETKSMTHYLRLHHDAILVGVGTAIPDDPSLNCRYPGASFRQQPRPIVVDPHKRWDVGHSKLAQLAVQGKGKVPWLFHVDSGDKVHETGKKECERIYVELDRDPALLASSSSVIAWPVILKTLKKNGINSVMIEGGATIISTLLRMPELVNSVIVTIAPTWLGQGGVSISPNPTTIEDKRVNAATLTRTAWRQFGADAVLCGTMRHPR